MDERNEFIENGWRQFCIVRPEDHALLCKYAHFDIGSDDLLLIVTQTCDLVNDVEKEPFFEVARLHPLAREPSNDYMHGKNNRRLDLLLNVEGTDRYYSILAYERFFARHELLKEIRPYSVVQEDLKVNLLVKWITSRYNRAAFPDAFDRRWKSRRKQIETILKQLLFVQDLYIRLDPFTEIVEDREYTVSVLLLMDAVNYDDPVTYTRYDQLRKKLETQFGGCPGIHVEAIEMRSNAEISVKELQTFARWDYSYLSYRDPLNHVGPA